MLSHPGPRRGVPGPSQTPESPTDAPPEAPADAPPPEPRYPRQTMPRIDLRSDTVTHPTPAMRRAMAEAEVGDDVFGDDPTVNALEERAAALLGKEAGLFVASGTMGNLVAQMAHLGRGQETIASAESHLVMDEAAGHAVVVGTSIRALPDRPDGTLDLDLVAESFRDPEDPHEPISGLVAIENTHAHSMGQPLTVAYTQAAADVAHAYGVPLHVDGARFFNAVVALSVDPAALAGPADSVTFCLSKGLACPIGSVVVGSRAYIWRARRARKLLGGGMRQVGVLAAPGLLALSDGPDGMIARLADDHANARRLAEGLADLAGIESPGGAAQPTPGRLDPARARTNFVIFRVARDRAAFLDALQARGVLMVTYPHGTIRAVTHYGITADDIDATLAAVRAALAETAGSTVGAAAAAGA
jgi:threonine aldolase